MITFKQYILQESADETNKHLTHLDELVLVKGLEGGEKTINYIDSLLHLLHGHTDKKINTTVKVDGAPAIVCGLDNRGKFFIGTKSAFAQTPKLNYTVADIRKNHGDAPGLVDKLIQAFEVLKRVEFDGVYQGDLLFWPGLVQNYKIGDEMYIGYRPNTILYTIKSNTPEAKKVLSSRIGVCFHTKYVPTQDQDGNVRFINKQFGIKVDHLSAPGAYIKDATIDNKAGSISLTNQETAFVRKGIQSLQYVLTSINFNALDKSILDMVNIFINSQIRRGQFLDDVDTSLSEFKSWVTERYDREIDKLKRKETRILKRDQTLKQLDRYSDSLLSLFRFIKETKIIKDIFLQKYNAIMQGVATGTFLMLPNGDFKVTNPEGYVAFDDAQNGIKLIDRLSFSQANFNIPKTWIKNENV